jgi:hypothetical protein
MATSTVPVAPVGYIGYGLVWGYPIRGMNFNVKAHQQIFNGDPASNIPDQPIWHVGPLEVEGDVSWPVVLDDPVTYKIIQAALTKVGKGGQGTKKTLEAGDVQCFFPPAQGTKSYARKAENCLINRLSFKATGGERVEAAINVIGLRLVEGGSEENASSSSPVPFNMGRVLTWDDVNVVANVSGEEASKFSGCTVKEFNFEINNNITRANTYCWPDSAEMKGTDITASALILGRRQVSGNLTFIGSSSTQETAANNIQTVSSEDELVISFGIVQAKFHRVVYELQQIDLSSGIIYGRTSFTAHGDGPGLPSVEFTMDAEGKDDNQKAWQQSLNSLDAEMSQRKL